VTGVELELLLGIIGTILGIVNLLWLFIDIWWGRRLVKCLNVNISCEHKKAGQENYLIMNASISNVGRTRVRPDRVEVTLISEGVEFFDETKPMWKKKLIVDCKEFFGEIIDPDEVLHRGYIVKTKGTGPIHITFIAHSPGNFMRKEGWTWQIVKCYCVSH